MSRIKLDSLEFYSNGVRKLKNIKLEFGDRFTIIAGHNGVGKSTILGLIASSSGMPEEKTYFDTHFSIDINQIIHFDPEELTMGKLCTPWPKATYIKSDREHWKNIRLTKRPERLRSVPSTNADSPDKSFSKQDGKVPIPTIYLGVLRMLPIGESLEANVNSENIETMEEEDKECIKKFVNSVISGCIDEQSDNFTGLSVKYTSKSTKHPPYMHSSKSASLGQDSLSSFATAIASFNKLKRELGESYPGGLLVIDEIDAGFHPHAQKKLIEALSSAARKLSLQIIATTHSPRIIELIHPDSTFKENYGKTFKKWDTVIYLADTRNPTPVNWSLDKILADMSLSPIPSLKKDTRNRIKIYLKDEEAAIFFKGILGMRKDHKTLNGVTFKLFPLGIGGTNLIKLPSFDSHFENVILLVDADITVPNTRRNALKLPCPKDQKLSPEFIMYSYIEQLVNDGQNNFPYTYNKLIARGITSDRLSEELLRDASPTDRESFKKWFKSKREAFERYDLFSLWASDHIEEMQIFKNNLNDKLSMLSSRGIS